MSDDRLKNLINSNRLWAFADDLIIGFYTKEDLELTIRSVRNLGINFNLIMHEKKTKFISM